MDKNFYYFSDVEWSKVFGYSSSPEDCRYPENWHREGEIRVTPTGDLEIYSEGSWIPKY